MKKAFTLAEVLITLVIIGIIAAITIPIVMQNQEKAKLYSQFRKTYSTLNQAMNMSIALGTFPSGFDFQSLEGSKAKTQEFLDNYIKPYVKIIDVQPCFGMETTNPMIKNLAGGNFANACALQSALSASDALILQDGSVVAVLGSFGEKYAAELVIDVNGAKGPNTIGRDIHIVRYIAKGDKPKITGNAYRFNELTGDFTLNESYYKDGCDPKKSSGTPGDTCADRLLKEGKMNY